MSAHNCRGCMSKTTSRNQIVVDPATTADRNVGVLKRYLHAIAQANTPRQAKLLAKALGVSLPPVRLTNCFLFFTKFVVIM